MEKEARKRGLPFLTAMAKSKQLYGTDMTKDDFIEMAYDVWRTDIGNTATKIERKFARVPADYIIELPDDCEAVQSVTLFEASASKTRYNSAGVKDVVKPTTMEATAGINDSLTTTPGQSVNYILHADAVQITSQDALDKDILIVYKAVEVDNDGLPLLNDKEVAGIAAEVAKRMLLRRSFQGANLDKNLLGYIATEAQRLLAAAKVDEYINDDALDKALDIKTSWNRKTYGNRINLMK